MKSLVQLRKEINEIDNRILRLLSERFACVEKIGEYKKRNNLPIVNKKREEIVLLRLTVEAKKYGISEVLIKNMWHLIFEESYKKEK